jgi:hypothetical protein
MKREIFWTKEKIRIVFATCRANPNKQERLRILQDYFPDRSLGSIGYQIMRYQKRNDNTLRWIPEQNIFEGFGANGRLHDEVWGERDWRTISVIEDLR